MGAFYTASALIDSGSEGLSSQHDHSTALKMPAETTWAQISGLINAVSARCYKACSLVFSYRFDPVLRIKAKAFVNPQLTGKLPSCSSDITKFQQLPGIQLADSDFYTKSDRGLLLVLGQETLFGWILSGPIFNIYICLAVFFIES